MITTILFSLLFSFHAHSETPLPLLTQYQDKESAGWAYKVDDQAFEMNETDCNVKWNVETPKDSKMMLTIFVHEKCSGNLARAQQFGQNIFKAILAKYPKEKLGSVIAHSWCQRPEWEERMAVAGVKETSSKLLKPKADNFKRLFQNANVASEESDFFASQGLALSLSTVEKILAQPFNKFDFAAKYPEYVSSKKHVPFSAMCWFSLKLK